LIRKATLATTLTAMLLVAPALAAETTREEYKTAVEPICKANKQSSDRLLKPVKSLVKADKLQQAAQRFAKAATALERAEKQLAAVPQPSADETKLGKWLAGIKGEVALMRTISAKLKQGNAGKASSLAVKLTHNATTTNNLVIAFQFDYCKIDPARYS
jgi:hypothetical protein